MAWALAVVYAIACYARRPAVGAPARVLVYVDRVSYDLTQAQLELLVHAVFHERMHHRFHERCGMRFAPFLGPVAAV